jgi:signal transduction histidine kinase
MTGPSAFQIVAAGVHFVPALVWVIVAQNSWRLVRTRQPQSHFFRMLPWVGTAVAINYLQLTLICLIPIEIERRHLTGVIALFVWNDWMIFAVVALARHMAYFFPTPERLPSRAWLAVNYGSLVLISALDLFCRGPSQVALLPQYAALYAALRILYQVVMLSSILVTVVRLARPGGWGSWSGVWMPRRADAWFLGGGLLSMLSWLVLLALGGWQTPPQLWEPTPSNVALDMIAGIGFVAPLAVRILGEVVRGFVITAAMLLIAGVLSHGVMMAAAVPALEAFRPLVNFAFTAALVLLLVPGHTWLRGAVDHLIFRRRRRRREELQNFLHTLSPELGAAACCRRALVEVVRVMPLRGVAIVLDNGDVFEQGAISVAAIAREWPRSTATGVSPDRALVGYELRELPVALQGVVSDAGIVGVAPIVGGRHAWGTLFISTSLLAATFSAEDVQTIEAFTDQLALILDGAELLARVVSVERSLAHSERLAAIGELAARVAHEIRNPVTAARSLAQQLAEEPASPLNADHAGLILTELDRVERQVAALLRFARREEFQFAPVDLGELARTTVDALRPRLEAAGITVAIDAPAGITAQADREKLRQVLINLIENARDALADENTNVKRLSLVVNRHNGSATLQVSDTGPGVPPEALARLFEPFFSLKPQGTGLGLAIAQRTIEAHGGTLTATGANGRGMTFAIELPAIEAIQ